ncbi:MAG TPA: hypothetical protein VIY26_08845, partial [Acidimicrobiales bacterium]
MPPSHNDPSAPDERSGGPEAGGTPGGPRAETGGGDIGISLEEIEDAVVDGDSPLPARSGTARAALR